jgi:hypothetical protein
MSRSDWISILIGVALGLAVGLYYAWSVSPVEYIDTSRPRSGTTSRKIIWR